MGDIEAKVDAVEFAVECIGECADRGPRGTFRRSEPNEIAVGLLLDDGETGRNRFMYDKAVRSSGRTDVLIRLRAAT